MPDPQDTLKNPASAQLAQLGQEVGSAGKPVKDIASSLPALKLPIGDAAGSLGKLTKGVPSAKTLQTSIPNIQSKITPLQKQIPDVASQLDPPKKAIQGLTKKLTDAVGGAKPLLDAGPLSQALQKAGTADLVKQHLAAAQAKLPQVPPLLDQAKAKITAAMAPLSQAGSKLGELQGKIMAAVPPPPSPSLDGLQQQINGASASVTQAAAPVNAAVTSLPAAQANVVQAQALAAKASGQMKPPELKQSMDQVGKLIADAQKQVVAPAPGLVDSAAAVAPLQNQLSAINDAGATTLPAAMATVEPQQQANAAALAAHAQNALSPLATQMAETGPTVNQLADQLPQLSAPLAQATQAMNDALTPEQQDLAELERQLQQAEEQMTALSQQAEGAPQQLDQSQQKVQSAASIEDPAALGQLIDEINAELPQLDDQAISDLTKKIPDFEALIERIEKSGGAA